MQEEAARLYSAHRCGDMSGLTKWERERAFSDVTSSLGIAAQWVAEAAKDAADLHCELRTYKSRAAYPQNYSREHALELLKG